MVRHIVVGLVLSALAASCNHAAPTPAATPSAEAKPSPSSAAESAQATQTFSRYDLNKDSRLDLSEFVDGKYGDMRFIKAPTEAETTAHKADFQEQFEQLDGNKDQRLTLAEFAKSLN